MGGSVCRFLSASHPLGKFQHLKRVRSAGGKSMFYCFNVKLFRHSVTILAILTPCITENPGNPCPEEENHYRPVAFTLITTKCLERLVAKKLCISIKYVLNSFQFAHDGQMWYK